MTTTTKERPIMFSWEMVRAILAGRKTQTRRMVKPQPRDDVWAFNLRTVSDEKSVYFVDDDYGYQVRCPYGKTGDRLWVRETHSFSGESFPLTGPIARFDPSKHKCRTWYAADNDRPTWAECKWRPSIHMHRWASRLTLEITDIRVERLHRISEADAQAEGVQRLQLTSGIMQGVPEPFNRVHPLTSSYADAFREAWYRINSPASWDANPWVWVVSFKRIAG